MNPTDFLYKSLEHIALAFPRVHIKYSFNGIINTHVVELLPIEEYQNNTALDNAWIPLSFKFRETFPSEEITFISSDSTLAIQNPIFEFNALACYDDPLAIIFESLSTESINYSFPTIMPVVATFVGNSITKVLSYPEQQIDDRPDLDLDTFYQAAA